MAKKTVATLQEGKKDGRSYTKVIKMVKNPENGAYFFDERWFRTKLFRTFSRTKVSIVYLLYTLSQLREGFLYLQIQK